MFQFATFALHTYVFSMQYPCGWVSPFGNLRINACLLAPRSLSQATTSFIACNRQGIRHVHLVTCPYNFSLFFKEKLTLQDSVCFTSDFTAFAVLSCFETRMLKRLLQHTITTRPLHFLQHQFPSVAVHDADIYFTSSKLLKNDTEIVSKRPNLN